MSGCGVEDKAMYAKDLRAWDAIAEGSSSSRRSDARLLRVCWRRFGRVAPENPPLTSVLLAVPPGEDERISAQATGQRVVARSSVQYVVTNATNEDYRHRLKRVEVGAGVRVSQECIGFARPRANRPGLLTTRIE